MTPFFPRSDWELAPPSHAQTAENTREDEGGGKEGAGAGGETRDEVQGSRARGPRAGAGRSRESHGAGHTGGRDCTGRGASGLTNSPERFAGSGAVRGGQRQKRSVRERVRELRRGLEECQSRQGSLPQTVAEDSAEEQEGQLRAATTTSAATATNAHAL